MAAIEIIIPSPIALAGTAAAESARKLAGLAVKVHSYEDDAFISMYSNGGVLGLKVFMPVLLRGRDEKGLPKGIASNRDIKLECVIFEIIQTKRVILTDVNGMDGSVVEFISNSNYQVNMQVLIGGTKKGYPIQAVVELETWLKQAASFKVENTLMYRLGIYNLVCIGYSVTPSPGFENIQRFEINCVSDLATEFKLNPNV